MPIFKNKELLLAECGFALYAVSCSSMPGPKKWGTFGWNTRYSA
jgi:hypothetical protein